MSEDYVPNIESKLAPWCNTLSDEIVTAGPIIGISPSDIGTAQGSCKKIVKAINDNDAAKKAAKQAQKDKDTIIDTNLKILRAILQAGKKDAGYTKAIGESLGIEGSHSVLDTDTYKPGLSGVVFPGHVTLKFTKKGVEGVNIYTRLKGQPGWTKLSFDSHSPYVDNRPLAVAETPENREYMAIGVLDDSEIGQMSDITELTFGG